MVLALLVVLLLHTSRSLYLQSSLPDALKRASTARKPKVGSKKWLEDLRQHGRTSLTWLEWRSRKANDGVKPQIVIDRRDLSDKLRFTLTDPPSLPPRGF